MFILTLEVQKTPGENEQLGEKSMKTQRKICLEVKWMVNRTHMTEE